MVFGRTAPMPGHYVNIPVQNVLILVIALRNDFFNQKFDTFLILSFQKKKNVFCSYSLEVPLEHILWVLMRSASKRRF